jgi:integrase
LNATINRELAVLVRAFSLAVKAKKVPPACVPSFPRLAEPHAHRGFLDDKQVTALSNSCASVGLWLRSMLEVARLYGCRAGELKQLRVGQVDISAGTVNLEQTKNGEDRVIVMAPTSTVKALLKQCTSGKSSTDYVFTRTTVSR